MKQITLSNWELHYGNQSYPSTVPGDVTLDLWKGGAIENPYFGINHKKLHWIIESDFEYQTAFDLTEEIFHSEDILLEFDSIDTFAEIYLNGQFLGRTEDMFLKYSFSIKEFAKISGNVLKVKMLSTKKEMDKFDTTGYAGVFNVNRLFIRKAQCHFGWDWAPDMPGYGICGNVCVTGVYKNRIKRAHYRVRNNGKVSLLVELTYSVRPYFDAEEKKIKDAPVECKNDELRYILAKNPNEELTKENSIVHICKVTGQKNFNNFKIDNPELWWPVGHGEHPLYAYKIQLIREGKVLDECSGNLAFREIGLEQDPIDENSVGYKLLINGKEIFAKGSNWVPTECFIGSIKDEKYERLIQQAVEANYNMLRVWGGGIYEKDIFYDICDRKGIMVWQDFMFACADIPEEDPHFVGLVKKEIEYQLCRLRNHPSIVYWCGGNEKTGCYGLEISHGDYFVDVIVRGLVSHFDDSRPYARQSPCSFTDYGNDKTSGESHAGSFESSLLGALNYRNNVSTSAVSFVSECAIMGPSSLEGYTKMFPENKLWPMNEYWDDRLMDNPYASVLMTFAKRQAYYAETLYGKSDTIDQFIAKGMTVHAEAMRAEIEFARANPNCGGFMNWMYSDIWPSATWAVVDYYCEPKQVYYQMKRSFAPVLVTFVQNTEKQLKLYVINDGLGALATDIVYGLRTLKGETLWSEKISVGVEESKQVAIDIEKEYPCENSYLFAEYEVNGEKKSTVFSYDMWHTCKFNSNYTYSVQKEGGRYAVKLQANEFAKGITLRFPDNYKYTYSDNYIDLQAGESVTVYIDGADEGSIKNLVVTDFAKEVE